MPYIAKIFGFDAMDSDVSNFFKAMVMETMDEREKKNIFRPDMINILMQVRKGQIITQQEASEDQRASSGDGFATVEESTIGTSAVKRKWTDNQIIGQAFVFFLAGFDTSSNLLTMLAYELVANPDIQQKLHDEIEATNESRKGKRLDYDTLQKMKYMDQVVSETLRKWPPAPQIDRLCVKDYSYDDGSLQFNVNKGTPVFIPVYGIHHDPQYYPNPERFDPERFSDENKDDIVQGSFIPFGVGPRNCIGMCRSLTFYSVVHNCVDLIVSGSRFALMEVKAVIYYLLLSFKLEANEKTDIPIVLKKTPFNIITRNGLHLRLKPRKV